MTLLIINFRKEGSFFGSKTGDACGITKYLTTAKGEEPYYSKINMFGDRYPVKPAGGKKKSRRRNGSPQDDTSPQDDISPQNDTSPQDVTSPQTGSGLPMSGDGHHKEE